MAQKVRNSSKVPVLRALLAICGDSGETTVPEVEGKLLEMGVVLSPMAVGVALMRYSKQGTITRRRVGKRFYYSPNRRTLSTLRYLEESTAAHKHIDFMVGVLDFAILSDDVSTRLADWWVPLLLIEPGLKTVPARTTKILHPLASLVRMLASREKASSEGKLLANVLAAAYVVDHNKPKPKATVIPLEVPLIAAGVEERLADLITKRHEGEIRSLEARLEDAEYGRRRFQVDLIQKIEDLRKSEDSLKRETRARKQAEYWANCFMMMAMRPRVQSPHPTQATRSAQPTVALPTHDVEGNLLPMYSVLGTQVVMEGKVLVDQFGVPLTEHIAVVSSEAPGELKRVRSALKGYRYILRVLSERGYEEFLKKQGPITGYKVWPPEPSNEKKPGTKTIRYVEMLKPCIDNGSQVLDENGKPALVRFKLVRGDIGDLLFLSSRSVHESDNRGLELLEEDEEIIPLLTHGPIAGILPDLCFCEFDIDRLEVTAKKKVLKVIEERGPEIYGLRDAIRKTVIEDQFVPKLARFFDYFERHRRSKYLWVKPLLE